MDLFRKRRFLPIDVMIVLALNAAVVVLGYYAVMIWGLLGGS
jgi:hypothetical protein